MLKTLYFAKNIISTNFGEGVFPYRFTYIVTYQCQLKCNMCNIWQRAAKEEAELPLEQIKIFFQRSNKFSWVNLSGGEIFLRKDLLDIIRSIVSSCHYLYLLDFPTNGMCPDLILRQVKQIVSFRIPKVLVTVSLDGPPELHDEIRGIRGSWVKAVDTFRELRRLRNKSFGVFFGMTLQVLNRDKLKETIDSVNRYIGKVGFDDFHINIAHKSSHYYGNLDIEQDSNIHKLQEQLGEIIKLRKNKLFNPIGYLESKYMKLAQVYLEKKITPITCQALSASFFMDPSGNIYPCSIYDRPLGNIMQFDYDIIKVWNSSKRKGLRDLIKNKICPHCWTPCEAYQSILANFIPKLKL